ncbi:MAG TPA: hypothetical protein VNP96_00015 [Solirubrobacterales bacterium]|nr:hypothetical protein [Solirubrobacterales bacterium]
MAQHERDSTQDWQLPEHSRPPLIGELVERIDEALATARASEAAVMTVGAAALDAAEQARRAADLAEKASAAMLDRGPRSRRASESAGNRSRLLRAEPGDDSLRDFKARADRVSARLRELERLPIAAGISR